MDQEGTGVRFLRAKLNFDDDSHASQFFPSQNNVIVLFANVLMRGSDHACFLGQPESGGWEKVSRNFLGKYNICLEIAILSFLRVT